MFMETKIGESLNVPDVLEKRTSKAGELEQALALYDAMAAICSTHDYGSLTDRFDVSAVVPFLEERIVPWPQIQDLADIEWYFRQRIDGENNFSGFDPQEELLALTNDLSIWIVEHYYRPTSLAQVRALKPEFQRAGLGYILYQFFEAERQYLEGEEYRGFQRLFEFWINAVWDGKVELPLPARIVTIGQLIAWLADRDADRIPACIVDLIEEIEERVQ
jgi:hypothetical protein